MSLAERIEVHDLGGVVQPILARNRCTLAELGGASRRQHVVAARRELAEYLSRTAGWSNRTIGELFGRDASTVHNLLHPKKRRAS